MTDNWVDHPSQGLLDRGLGEDAFADLSLFQVISVKQSAGPIGIFDGISRGN